MNLLTLAPKFSNKEWAWLKFVLSQFDDPSRATDDDIRKMMFLNLEKAKEALNWSMTVAAINDEDLRLYKILYGREYGE